MPAKTRTEPVTEPDNNQRERQFADDLAQLLQAWNVPLLAGKILGFLCLSDTTGLSTGELADRLETNTQSIDSNVRLLTAFGLVKRDSDSKSRHQLYLLNPAGWASFIGSRISLLVRLRQHIERGIELKWEGDGEVADGMRTVDLLCSAVERELRELLERLADSDFKQKGESDTSSGTNSE